MAMTRDEHLAWCKRRAFEEMEYYGEASKGIISMMSDLRKHPETNNDTLISLCTMMMLTKPLMTIREATNFINGFN